MNTATIAQRVRFDWAMPSRAVLGIAVSAALLLTAVVASLSVGAVKIPPASIVDIIAGAWGDATRSDDAQAFVLLQIRLPRTLLAVLVGASLAIAGAAMQGLFRNPLADPTLIGVSAGAALGAVSVIVLGGSLFSVAWLGDSAVPLAAFVGSLLATAVVKRLATSEGRTDVATLLLAGVAVQAVAMAGVGLLTYLADDAQLRTLSFWTLGSLGGAGWSSLLFAAPLMLAAILIIPAKAAALNAMLLGEAEAGHLGFDTQRLKRVLVLLVSGAVGAAVAVSGIIGFVGLVVPHLLRLIVGPDHRWLLPGSALLGAALMLSADLLARTLVVPAELPIGIITALLGGPFFIWLLVRRRQEIGV